MREIEVLIRGAYGKGNLGDDMLMIASNLLIKKVFPEEKIAFLSINASYLKRLLPNSLFIPPSSCKIKCDLLVLGGGTQFCSFPLNRKDKKISLNRLKKRIKSPLNSYIKLFKRHILRYKVFPLKYAAVGLGLGPFVPDSEEEINTKKILKKTDFIAVRDINSLEICKKWGIKNALLRTDLCFMPEIINFILGNLEKISQTQKKIGVIVRNWHHDLKGNSYVSTLREAVKELRALGFEIRYILFSEKDKDWINILINDRESFILWEPSKIDILSFFSELNNFDAFITSRYHGAVFASILKKPVICIEIEPKLYQISKLLERGSELWYWPFYSRDLVRLSLNLFNNYQQKIYHLNKIVNKQRSLALVMEDEFKKFIKCI